ncbi:PP2C family protein-serine/threonine phosphatase [Savagea faecisuis]|uniref:PP2C family protein-serine/threonine phosphatase n=1 Tax=Savagea faecisuis TaxID=1274803 RepID=A0ABW3GZ20_9BACL
MMDLQKQYQELLEKYLENLDEKNLYFAQQFSRKFIEQEIAPEDVVSLHKDAVMHIFPELREEVATTHDFLIEMMIHYGLALREHQSLIKKREELHMEMEVAANVQEKLMNATRPNMDGLDIGYVSEAAKTMSGDYIYFAEHGQKKLSVAVADVIGKGIPAALCMSMIKFGMDSIDENESVPSEVLKIINRIVEKSVDNSMFISMYYGMYNVEDQHFTYASAGHEPALLYCAKTKKFEQLDARGLLLGVKREVEYEEQRVQLHSGDFVAIMTDGVTEIRTEDGFLDSSIIEQLLYEVSDQSAQQMADHLFKELSQLQNFRLHDDFTVAIMKKN